MPLPSPSLFAACRGIAAWLERQLGGADRPFDIVLGSPAQAAAAGAAGSAGDRLNLFFYAFGPASVFPDSSPTDPWLLRAQLLLTPFAAGQNGTPAGEGDLRILGEAMRILHEAPLVTDADDLPLEIDDRRFRLDAIFQPLSLEEINHLWSMQGETTYRVSVAYEIALVPVVPRARAEAPKLVGALGLAVDQARTRLEDVDSAALARPPSVPRSVVDLGDPGHLPRIAFLHEGELALTLTFAVGAAPSSLRVRIASASGEELRLRWQRWSEAGFVEAGDPVDALAEGPVLDPREPEAAPGVLIDLPDDVAGQYLLHARRTIEVIDNGALRERELSGNALLVTIHEAA